MADIDQNQMKKLAGEKAVEQFVKDGMTVGLGTGSTAYYVILKIAELVKQGYKLKCVATSIASEKLAIENGIEMVDLNEVDHVDVTIDGADEVDPKMNLIKGLGGALLREKIVAAASVEEVIVVDESKLVEKIGTKVSLPVEVLQFGHVRTAFGLRRQGCEPVLRMKDGKPFVTDGGNYIYDCKFENGIDYLSFKETALDAIPGVVENGLFINLVRAVVIARKDGTVEIRE
ncbi:MAG: ribose 5-phosphate isomerase A [archaeon]|nr:ribose 5-phosphate isomerase A [archaeon]